LSPVGWRCVLSDYGSLWSEEGPPLLSRRCRLRLSEVAALTVAEAGECLSVLAVTEGLDGAKLMSLFYSSRLNSLSHILEGCHVALIAFPSSSATPVIEEALVRVAQAIHLTLHQARLLFLPPRLKGERERGTGMGRVGRLCCA